jgi:hypothetical protein
VHRIVVDERYAPPGAAAAVTAAFKQAGKLAGLRFAVTRGRVPAPHLGPPGVDPAGAWPPITVSWAPPGAALPIRGAAGVAAPTWIARPDGSWQIVTAWLRFSADYGTPALRTAIALHEVGHAVGLDHVRDRRQVMYPIVGQTTHYGPGDRAGFNALRQACKPGPAKTR